MGGLDPIGKKKLPSSNDINNGLNRPGRSWGFRMFQAGVIGAMPSLLYRLREQALGYVSVNASEAAMDAAGLIGFVHWLTIAGALLFMLTALLHLRLKTPHALLAVLVCGATFAVGAWGVNGEADEAWAAQVRSEPSPCQAFYQQRKQLGQDGATQGFLVGACMAYTEADKRAPR